MKLKDSILFVRVPKELRERLDREAMVAGLGTSEYVRRKLETVVMPNEPVVKIIQEAGVPFIQTTLPLKVLGTWWPEGRKRVRQKPTKAVKTLHSGRAK